MNGWTATEPNGPGNGWRVGPAWLGSDASSDETRQAAHLIAAAPDLLAALDRLVRCVNHMDENPAMINARAVLEKARGK